jgi:AcrR family transcriptional regulator
MNYWEHPKPVQRERAVAITAVAGAASDLLDEGGLRALTLRAVATRLDVAPASLYSRVGSVDDLFDLALDAVLGDDTAVSRAVAEDGLEELLLAYYRHLVAHRWACQVIAMRPPRGPNYLRLSERICDLLLDAGAQDPLGAAYSLSNFVIGSASTAPVSVDELRTPVDPAIAPHYARLHAQRREGDAERTVAAGLTVLISHFGHASSSCRER